MAAPLRREGPGLREWIAGGAAAADSDQAEAAGASGDDAAGERGAPYGDALGVFRAIADGPRAAAAPGSPAAAAGARPRKLKMGAGGGGGGEGRRGGRRARAGSASSWRGLLGRRRGSSPATDPEPPAEVATEGAAAGPRPRARSDSPKAGPSAPAAVLRRMGALSRSSSDLRASQSAAEAGLAHQEVFMADLDL